MISSKTSNDLFNKIRSKFSNVQLGNALGEVTADTSEAVFFDFEFSEDSDNFGRVSISIADGENMKVFYNRELINKIDENQRDEWYSFLKELKDFAVQHQITFDVRDITKNNLTKQDYKNIADTNQTVNTDDMSEEINRITKLAGLAESLSGTSKSSFENLDKTRLIIRHSKAVDENIPGDRTRNINSLYIENEDGERFKYPIVHLAGARAMARHVANGGVPHDDFGKHIIGVSEQIAQLNSFARYTTNKDQLNDSAGDIIEKAKIKLETMRKYIKGLSKQKNYESIKETFQPTEIVELDDATKESLREKFTLKHMDDRVESALPLIHNIMKEYDDEIADPEMDKPLSDKDAEIPAPVNVAPIVQQYLADPENKLVLRKDDTADTLLKRTKFTNKNTMLGSILSDIASRMLTKTPEQDRVANFASHVANEISQEDEPFFEPSKDYIKNKKIAFQLAKRYIDDYKKMQNDPAYQDQVRMEPAEFGNPKKDRQGRAKEDVEAQFESWADNIAEQKPYVSMYSGEDGKQVYDVLDKDGESAYKSGDYNDAVSYLRKNFNTLAGKETAMDSVNENDAPMIIDGKEVDPSSIEYDMQDYGDVIAPISAAKFIDGTELTDDQMADLEASSEYSNWVRNDYNDRAMSMADDVNMEGNDFAQAVNKAKAAGMKPGDKFTVGDKEYTLKDAIERAGLQLETFFNEDSDDHEGSFEYEFTGDDGEMAWGKIHYKAVNGQVDPKSLQGESEYEGNARVDDDLATQMIQPGGAEHDEALLAAQEDYDEIAMKMQSKFEQPESEDNNELDRIKHLSNIGNEDHAQEIPKGYHKMPDGTVMKDSEHKIKEAKPDFLDLDKDGNKSEPMKSAAQDAKKESSELDSIRKLAGI